MSEENIPKNSLFINALKDTIPLKKKGREIQPAKEKKKKIQIKTNNSSPFIIEEKGEQITGFAANTDTLISNRLQAGFYRPQAKIDLHKQTINQSFELLLSFFHEACTKKLSCVLIITGKGKNSPFGAGIIKVNVQQWFAQKPFKDIILAFSTALPQDGGSGAFYVLLRKNSKISKNIISTI